MKTDTVKGFNDYIGEEAANREVLRKRIIYAFERYGFSPAETPVVEYEEFAKGDKSQANDEAISDMFKLQDKGKRKLALRYEFTFPLKRIMKNQKLPFRRYQIGPVFRDEPVSANRFRQFIQCDADVIGSSLKDTAEVLSLGREILENLKIESSILINSRKLLNEILEAEGIKTKDKEKVLRELDRYDKISEKELKNNLKKYNAEKILTSFKKGEVFFKQFPAYQDILEIMKYCKLYGFKVLFSPTIIRGLGYYNGIVFEIKAKKMKETIIAGGEFMFNNTQCTGISFGLDRLSMLSKVQEREARYLVISLNQDKEAIKLARKLRSMQKVVSIFYGKPSKALDYANSYQIDKVIFVGEKEVKNKSYKVKDMKTGKEKKLVF